MEASIYEIETVAIVQPDEDSEARWLFVAGELKSIQPRRGQDSCLKIGAAKSFCVLDKGYNSHSIYYQAFLKIMDMISWI